MPRDRISDRALAVAEQWDLEPIFPGEPAFAAARKQVAARLPELAALAGTLGSSGEALAAALELRSEIAKELSRLHAWASMRSDSDTRIPAHQAAREEIELLWTEFSRACSFLRPETLALAPQTIDGFVAATRRLAPYRHFLDDLMRQRRHVLSPPEERLMAESGLLAGGPHAVFNLLHNAELPRPEVRLTTGETVTLNPSEFGRVRRTSERDDRRTVSEAFFGAYSGFRETLGQVLFQTVKGHMFQARSRGYDSCLSAALDSENIPTRVYHNLIEQVRGGLPSLHRYMRLRARALGVERIEYHDLHCPLVADGTVEYAAEQARALMLRSLEPLGRDYAVALQRAFDERWIDWRPRTGKRAGAYATGAAYDVHPYVLLNFTDDYESVSTLGHELGHAMHSYFSNRTQPYATAGYTIFVAEVASTFNEALLNERMISDAADDRQKLMLITAQLDNLRATLFRQTMFAEFELLIHERGERGEALTGEALSENYLSLLREYHGHDDGVMTIDDRYAIEWAAIPHFHYNFYVYQYSTGITAATALAEAVRRGGDEARDRYLRFLSAGGSDYSLQLLRDAGVDLERPEPYAATLGAFDARLDQLEALLERAGAPEPGS
jgi:oligoendopeptidase F